MNGFKDNVWKDIDKIETVELVLEDFGTMICMNRFKGIKSLTLINVGVSNIEVNALIIGRDCSKLRVSNSSGSMRIPSTASKD